MDWMPQIAALKTAIFSDANSIFFFPYVLCCFAITFSALYFVRTMSGTDALKTMLDKRIWWTKSTLTDVVVTAIYLVAFNGPTNLLQGTIMAGTYLFVGSHLVELGARDWFTLQLGPAIEATLACLITMLTFDFGTYVAHRLMHKFPVLWDIHLVHHSPETLNLFSAYRQNPLDRLIRNSLAGAFMGVGLGLFHVFFPAEIFQFKILGAGAGFVLVLCTVHLQHSHIPIHYPKWLRPLLLSPHLHQIHHSRAPRHHDKNFASIFPYWDRLFGTYHDEELKLETIAFGLGDHDPIRHQIWRCYLYPLINLPQRLRGAAEKLGALLGAFLPQQRTKSK